MQKGLYRHYLIQFINSLSRLRWTLQLIVAGLLLVTNVYSQNRSDVKVTLRLDNADIKQSLLALQQKSGIRFSFGEQLVKGQSKKVTADFKDTPLLTAVKEVLNGTNLSYKSLEDFVVIEEKPTSSPPSTPNVAAGQGQGTGGIKGRIVEFETSQPLPGATVRILELNKGMTADNAGYYHFTGLRAGKYTLQASFVSYNTESQAVEVRTGKDETYDVKMQGKNQLGEVVVTATGKTRRPVAHTTEKQVLEQVKQASVVISAISSEQISKSADRNAAEVMQRVAGVTTVDDKFVVVRGLNQRYSLTYLNDNVAPSTEVYSRAFALDLIPSRIIDKILVFKSPSPENQADATGGVVKIYTKDAKNVKHFDIEIQGGWRTGTTLNKDFLTYQGGKYDFLGFDDGIRKLPSSVPGYGNLTRAKISQSEYVKSFSPILTYGQKTALPNLQLTANYYNSFKVFGKQLAMLSSLSYKNERQHADVYREQGLGNDYHSIDQVNFDNRNTETAQLNLLQNFTYRLKDSSNIQFKNFLFQQGTLSTIVRHSHQNRDDYMTQSKDNILSYTQRFLYAGNLGGTHYFQKGLHKLQWNGGYTFSRQETPDQRVIRLREGRGAYTTGDTTLLWYARGRNPADGQSIDDTPIRLGIISRLWSRMSEGVYNASIDYTFQFRPWLSFKAGTFQQWKERRLDRRVYTINEGDITGTSRDYNTIPGGYGQYVDPNIVRFREQELPVLWSDAYFRNDLTGLKVTDQTSGSDSYQATEQNNSGYVAFSFTPANRMFEVYGGLRVEYNRQKIGGAIPPSNPASPTAINIPTLVDNPTTNWLPSINVSYRPTESWVARAAYGKTLNRFEFREASPYNELDFENNQIIMGNPLLKTATAENYDLRIEFYPRNNAKGEIISAGIFYKDLKRPIERITYASRVESYFPYITFQNAREANIKGIELELRKSLDFIPGKLFRNLSIIANASFIKSNAVRDSLDVVKLNEERGYENAFYTNTFSRPLQGQAPYIINGGLYYDNAASGTKVSAIYNVVGTRLYAAGWKYQTEPNFNTIQYRGSILELPRHQLDISFTQRIITSLQAKFSVQNLLGQEIRMAEDYNFTNKYEKLRISQELDDFGRPKKEGDNISSRFNPGRYFLLTLSYSL